MARIRGLSQARRHLERHGILLAHDQTLRAVSSMVAGESVSGSWWSHPDAHEIFAAHEALEDSADILVCKLVLGKATFVEERLWRDVLAVATSAEGWQFRRIAAPARELFERVECESRVSSESLRARGGNPAEQIRQLERRLLVYSQEVHTPTGRHAKVLESWSAWSARKGYAAESDVARAKSRLESAALALDVDGARVRLPWM